MVGALNSAGLEPDDAFALILQPGNDQRQRAFSGIWRIFEQLKAGAVVMVPLSKVLHRRGVGLTAEQGLEPHDALAEIAAAQISENLLDRHVLATDGVQFRSR